MPDGGSGRRPHVTVCVPTIGRRETLGTTLSSLRDQTFGDYEALILDNASPDDAQAKIARYARSDSRVSVLRSETTLPMFANFQRGVDSAAGVYVTFFHDDDVYAPDFLELQIAFLDANPTVAFAGSNCELIDAVGDVSGSRDLIRTTERWDGWRYIDRLFGLGSNLFPMQSIVFRRAWLAGDTFAAAEGVHYSDFVLLMRLAETHDVGLISRRLLQLRMHPEQASQQIGIRESLALRSAIFQRYGDELEERWPSRHAEITRLKRHVERARRRAAIWSWANAQDGRSARESRDALGDGLLDRSLATSLGALDAVGVARLLRAKALRRTLRGTAQFAVRASTSGR